MTPGEGQAVKEGDDPPGGRPEPSLRTPSLRILVAGAGAIGQWLGLRLLATGQDVTLLARPAHVEAIRGAGLRVNGETEAHGHIAAVADLAQVPGSFDCVVLACKAHQTAALGPQAVNRLKPTGFLLSLQNGLGNAEKLRGALPPECIAVGLTSHGVSVEKPGLLLHAGTGPTLVGPAVPGKDAAARRALQVLTQAGLEPEWHDDMRGFVWRKAIINHGINPVAALHGVRNGELLERESLKEQAFGLLREGEALARKAGVPLPPGDLAEAMRATLERTAANKCSMLQDVERKRPTEIEQLTGRLVRLGERLKVPMPLSASVYRQLKDLESSYLGKDVAAGMAKAEIAWERWTV